MKKNLGLFCLMLLSTFHVMAQEENQGYFQLHELELQEIYCAPGQALGKLSNPHGIKVDGKGMIYVADTSNHRIQIFDAGGKVCKAFGWCGSEKGELSEPVDLWLNGDDEILVLERGNNRIQKFDSTGKAKRFYLAGLDKPHAIVLDSRGNILISDTNNHRIIKMDKNGKLLFTLGGSRGKAVSSFDEPKGICVNSADEIIVTDNMNHRIQQFSASGEFIRQWGKQGTMAGCLLSPYGITLDFAGNLYIVGTYNHRIQKFSQEGKLLGHWKLVKRGEESFIYPFCIACDEEGNVFLTSQSGHIRKFTPAKYQWKGRKFEIKGKIKGAKRRANKKLQVRLLGIDKKKQEFFATVAVTPKGDFSFKDFPAKGCFTLELLGLKESGYKIQSGGLRGKAKKKVTTLEITLVKVKNK